jgi:hypothetical protein
MYTTTKTVNPSAPVAVSGSGAGQVVIAAPPAGLALTIRKGSVHNRAASETVVSLREGAGGTIRWTANLAADGGGSLIDFEDSWQLPEATALVADVSQASVDINISSHGAAVV